MSVIAIDEGVVAPAAPIRILVADDHPLIITGIRRTIELHEDIEVVGEAHAGGELIALVERRRPDLVLMDLQMPGVSGCECIEQIKSEHPATKIVVLSANDSRVTVDAALAAGADAYIVKSAAVADVVGVIRQALNSAVYHAPVIRPRPRAGESYEEAPEPQLTDRERSILAAVSSGKTTAAISRELWVSDHTVKFHLTNIYRKLGVANRTGAVRYAFEHGLAAAA
jgi:DNA-binding NarL/FixJ family response regulator